jgi:hypothetical protein
MERCSSRFVDLYKEVAMDTFKIPIEISLGALLLAGLLAGAAMAQTKEKEVTPPPAQVPLTPQDRTGLPSAPPEVVAPGSAARPFTGNDATQPTNQMTTVPKEPPATVPK